MAKISNFITKPLNCPSNFQLSLLNLAEYICPDDGKGPLLSEFSRSAFTHKQLMIVRIAVQTGVGGGMSDYLFGCIVRPELVATAAVARK